MTTASPARTSSASPISRFLFLVLGLQLSGCVYLPSAGPSKYAIDSEHDDAAKSHPFELIDITGASLDLEKTRAQEGFAEHFGRGAKAPELAIGVGDGLAIEIWEAASDALFSPRVSAIGGGGSGQVSARGTTLPEQTVGADGDITVPFVGHIHVAGHTQVEVEQQLTRALAGKTAQAEIVVHVRSASDTVTVVGDVTAGARVPLSVQGERLLDVLAAAGGVRAPTFETRIQLTRGTDSFTLPMLRVLQDPSENIYMYPGDMIVATHQAQSFTAFGATGRNAQINFDAEKISLIEAVAKTGGLLDTRADPRGVYLLRYEPRDVVEALEGAPVAGDEDEIRVIYRLDFLKAESYFLAQRFPMHDRDIVYVSSSPADQLQKFLELVGLISQPVIQGAVVGAAVK